MAEIHEGKSAVIRAEPPRRYVMRLHDVQAATGLSRAWIYCQMRANKFPKARKIGLRAVGWPSDEIDAWVNERMGGGRA
ncbi:Prophage CP4-57 regulatory protein (AlpA) [compost metagenome]